MTKTTYVAEYYITFVLCGALRMRTLCYEFIILTLLIFLFNFTCSPAGNYTDVQKYTYNDNQIE